MKLTFLGAALVLARSIPFPRRWRGAYIPRLVLSKANPLRWALPL